MEGDTTEESQDDTGQTGEQSAESGVAEGQMDVDATEASEASPEIDYMGLTEEQANTLAKSMGYYPGQDYKNIQSSFSTAQNTLKAFEAFGGAESVLGMAQHLSQDGMKEKFQEFMKNAQEDKESLDRFGFNKEELGEEGNKVLSQLEDMASAKAQEKFDALMENVNPVLEQHRQERAATLTKSLDDKYKDTNFNWREHEAALAKTVGSLSKAQLGRLTPEQLDGYLWQTLAQSGKAQDVAGKIHQAQLRKKAALSTGKQGTSGTEGLTHATSIEEAFKIAKGKG